MGGELEGVRIISAEGLQQALRDPEPAFDATINMKTYNTKAGLSCFSRDEWDGLSVDVGRRPGEHSTNGFFGWGGFGGSAMMFNPETQMGVAYCMGQWGNPLWCVYG